MQYLGIDYGAKHIGLALADASARLAVPHRVIPNTHDQKTLDHLREIARGEAVQAVVVGLPRGLDGQTTKQTDEVLMFVHKLMAALKLPIDTQDEAATSTAAAARGATGEAVHAEAATIILQDYLDSL
jgi:putative Holliday junction resolvase